ncbi:hypothetical protein BST81_21800 [Leptolyngbya sp. 'hensonii']|uniref:DUF5331 domain-containing protein n=1 Tax=Leptolyngbya sp. 'hensonii' TaxID=1922337 RepID=UPI00094F6CEB|nr:DUF5331 domain-containing protein [Leptolyngbya sp. 'hensonii']OLP16239.1 hypothetical protein BST81_21800 [Leptolyngbya sp. 'hensonii']
MSVEQLRQSLKNKWLSYYRDNRSWLVRLKIWGSYNGRRRPSSGFILATLSVLEPRLTQLLPLVVELNNDPDRIITALGLNFNPEDELKTLGSSQTAEAAMVRMLPNGSEALELPVSQTSQKLTEIDETCRGSRPEFESTSENPDLKSERKA